MKNARKRLIVLVCLIVFAIAASGYYAYSTFFSKQSNIIINELENEEEISLGDCNATCSKACASAGSSYNYCYNQCKGSCKDTCNPGYYLRNQKCVQCPAGSKCAGGTAQPVACTNKTYSTGGQSVCAQCSGVVNSTKTKCYKSCDYIEHAGECFDAGCSWDYTGGGTCKKSTSCSNVSISTDGKVSPNNNITVRGHINGAGIDGICEFKLTATSNRGQTVSGKLVCSGNTCKNAYVGKYPACTYVTVTAEGRGTIGVVEVETKFTEETVEKDFDSSANIPGSNTAANIAGTSYYGRENDCISNADGTKTCPVHVRSKCNTPTVYSYCCVNNGIIEASTDAIYKEYEPSKVCPANYTLLTNVKKENCKIKKEELGSCDTTTVSSPKKKLQADVCEDTVNMPVDEGKQCTNTVNSQKNSFYEITCAKVVKTNFDYGNDGSNKTTRTLYKGEGFAFGVNIDTTTNCKYTFYDAVWKTAYNNVINKIKSINSNLVQYVNKNDKTGWKNYIDKNILNKNGINNASELYRLWDIISQLRDVVDAYNKYKPSDDYKEQGRIVVKTKENKKEVTNKYELLQIVKNSGTYKTTNVTTSNLNVPLVTNPKNYVLTTSSPRSVTLIPKRTCIDKITGEVKTIEGNNKCSDNSIDGGNKIYISYNTDVTSDKKYTLSVEVDGLGTNNSEVKNDKCDLNVLETAYIYRPIDVGNPFINSSWEKGKNWVNDKYDFTKTIHSSTWSETTYKKIVITAKDVEAIKKSNSDNRTSSPYLGLCDKQNVTVQDEITRKLCEAIK